MRKYFKGIEEKKADGWMLAFVTGNSSDDNKEYCVDTNSLHADQVPGPLNDAKTCSLLMAGLLNAFYNNIETKDLSEEEIMVMGEPNKQEEIIPSQLNPTLPFDELPF